MDDNTEQYDFLFPPKHTTKETLKGKEDGRCLGPSYFVFRQYKTEKERVQVGYLWECLGRTCAQRLLHGAHPSLCLDPPVSGARQAERAASTNALHFPSAGQRRVHQLHGALWALWTTVATFVALARWEAASQAESCVGIPNGTERQESPPQEHLLDATPGGHLEGLCSRTKGSR